MNCGHHFCERSDHTTDPGMHETAVVETPTQTSFTVDSSVSYLEGAAEPELWLSAANARLSADDVDELIEALHRHARLMRQIQPTRALAVAQ